jgi:hypothetical protein
MQTGPKLTREELIEQAYFFRAVRQRIEEGWPTQDVLEHLQGELLATTRMPLAVDYMSTQLKHGGRICDAMAGLRHYFTGFQTYVVSQAESEQARFTFAQAMLILEREAEYKAAGAGAPGLFVYQLETLTRNQLGYLDGMIAMESDSEYDENWRQFIGFARSQVGLMDFAELIFIRSEHHVAERRKVDPDYEPKRHPLFGDKEGRIAAANRGRDPNYLFAAMQRQLGFPVVPRPPKQSAAVREMDDLKRRVKSLEGKLQILEGDVFNRTDPASFVSKDPNKRPRPKEST